MKKDGYAVHVGGRIDEAKFAKFEEFFNKHGEFSTFTCRLLPGIRQYISMPAGLVKMKLVNFILFTALGSAIWVAILVFLGYYIGQNEELIKTYLTQNLIIIIVFVILASLTKSKSLLKRLKFYLLRFVWRF